MSTVAPSTANGQGLYEGTKAFRAHDDLCDNKVAGVYTHNATRFSATECEELCDLQRYHNSILQSNAAPLVKNTTGVLLAAGTLGYISGYDSASGLLVFDKADASGNPAKCVLLSSIAIAGTGAAYPGGSVTGLDTSLGAVGDAVYLGAGGAWTLTPGTQVVGYVTTSDVASGAIDFIVEPYPVGRTSVIAGITTPVTVTAVSSGSTYTNDGAGGTVTFNLPTAVAGLKYTFIVATAQTLSVKAATGDYIMVAAGTSTSAGTCANATPYSRLDLTAINATSWVGVTTGTWTLA